MRAQTKARPRYRNGTIACTTTIAAAMLAGCGGAQSTPGVQLALTAPTEGAAVSVSNIKVFGTVDPANANVLVAGKRARVKHGAFVRWIALRKGLSQIKIEASAAGHTPANLSIAVTSSPSAHPAPAPSGASPSTGGAIARVASPTPPPAENRYETRVRTTFLRACEIAAGNAPSGVEACNCALSHVEAVASQRTLQATELAIARGEATVPQWLRDAALACKKT